ncbi:cytochrome b/b6 domain-containing protein [Pseudoroseomonas wenyumeiae]|uniref:Cytochrome b/b6 domain-containing protein n=1 Tax=Teichococcus wenyumeiae TaxID=2478470 RepID=A0A3A9JED9_9PROT|nr:cytochrome b/b6 domain-containing protein [Pseudoroseomonas wenyumeiae]RKK01986.1 cytochrome b/b6 domain-containing protein [Pseudoroseomonas wenyumeiae]RMI15226.1 cytochrome b/b6 domain-containing protein [Pseudoroseomonas wenyumeiae]
MTHDPEPIRFVAVHPLVVRITHWLNAIAMVCMIMSGWQIYNASPLFPFTFPRWATLGGWLGGAIAWHLAAMWLLVANALVYFAYGLAGRHFLRAFLPLTPRLVWRDLLDALTFRLKHTVGAYNAVQRLAYVVVLLLGLLAVASGLSLWKPVQLHGLAALLGGYEVARRIHFLAMAGIVAFIVLHLTLVALVPRTLVSMITGRARIPASHAEVEP